MKLLKNSLGESVFGHIVYPRTFIFAFVNCALQLHKCSFCESAAGLGDNWQCVLGSCQTLWADSASELISKSQPVLCPSMNSSEEKQEVENWKVLQSIWLSMEASVFGIASFASKAGFLDQWYSLVCSASTWNTSIPCKCMSSPGCIWAPCSCAWDKPWKSVPGSWFPTLWLLWPFRKWTSRCKLFFQCHYAFQMNE